MRKLGTALGVIVIISVVVTFNQAYQMHRFSSLHQDMLDNSRASLETRDRQFVDWDLFRQTKGSFESEIEFHADVAALDGKEAHVLGYGVPIGGRPIVDDHDGHDHASVLPLILPELFLGHSHAAKFKGQKEFVLVPYPLECYFRELPPVNEVILVEMDPRAPAEFGEGDVLALSGRLRLNKQAGPKFFYVLQDAKIVTK